MDDHRTTTRRAEETPSIADAVVENLLDGEPLDPKEVVSGLEKRNPNYAWIEIDDLDHFTQQFLEAAWFTDEERLKEEAVESGFDPKEHDFDWSQEALERAKKDCEQFQAANQEAIDTGENAGHDFWYTRNGHGVGFWDGDWEEPYATQLDNASKAFGEIWTYLGDDGLIYFH